jgi:hypothetical protein
MPRLRRCFFDLRRWCERELSEKELDGLRSFAALRMTAETGLCRCEVRGRVAIEERSFVAKGAPLDEGQERMWAMGDYSARGELDEGQERI